MRRSSCLLTHTPPADHHLQDGREQRRHPGVTVDAASSATPAPTAPTPTPCRRSAACAGSRPTTVPNKKFDCDVVYTNIPVPGAYRGYGAPQAEFALEAHMEDIAHALGMDPIEFKRKNWVKVGSELDIAPHLGERSVAEGELDEYPKVLSSGIEECVAQGQRAMAWHRAADPGLEDRPRATSHPSWSRASPSACTAPPSPSWTWAAAASRSTTTARSTC